MAEYREDDSAWPTMLLLAAEIERQIEACGLPKLCRSVPVPGPLAVIEACGNCKSIGGDCGGQGWVRLTNEYPSEVFPTQDQTATNCDAALAYTLEVGIARCMPVGKTSAINGFQPPTVEEMVKATRLQMADMRVMARAAKAVREHLDVAMSLGTYQPMVAQADCGGGVWTVTYWTQ